MIDGDLCEAYLTLDDGGKRQIEKHMDVTEEEIMTMIDRMRAVLYT